MNNKGLLLILILFCSTIVYISCRKNDKEDAILPAIVNTSRFFEGHQPTDARTMAVEGFVKRQNAKYNFVNKLISKIGYPIWDKAITTNGERLRGGRLTDDSSYTSYIPFVLDSANIVNASLVVNVSPNDTNFHFLCDWQYTGRAHGSAQVGSTAENFAILFMLLDKGVFGYKRFTLTDGSLFPNMPEPANATGRDISFRDSVNDQGRSQQGRAQLEETISYCFYGYVCGTPTWCTAHGGCDFANCPTGQCYGTATCFDFNVDSGDWGDDGGGGGDGGTGGDGGSGGGDPGGGWTPPQCPGGVARGAQYAECTPGWIPLDPAVPRDPCADMARFAAGTDFTLMLQSLKTFVPGDKENMYTFHDVTIPSSTSNAIGLTYGQANAFSVYPDPESELYGCWGWFHNHYANPKAGLIFSSGDVFKMGEELVLNAAQFHVNSDHFMIGVVCDQNVQYILMVQDMAEFTTFMNFYSTDNLMEILWNSAQLNSDELPISVADSELRFLNAIKTSGLKLFRGSTDFHTWTPIALNRAGTAVVEQPCP